MPSLARINLHPLKSFDPQPVERATLLAAGALEHDRRYALRDRHGDYVNGKTTPKIHRLRSTFDFQTDELSLRVEDTTQTHTFDMKAQRVELGQWLSDFLGVTVEIIENPLGGFPDDTDSPGPTVISTATLVEVGRWFDCLPLDNVRRRFRANLEIDGVEPFWEDRLVAEGVRVVRFRIGEAELLGTNPCQRCPVPTRDPSTGEPIREFAKRFAGHRQQSLPSWAPAHRFDHFYRLAANTSPARGKPCTIRVGDDVRILGTE